MPVIEETDIRGRVRQIIQAGENLPNDVRRAVLRLGASGVSSLLEILEDEALELSESPGEGWGPIHAADLLGKLGAMEAVEPMLRVLARTDPLDILHDRVIQSLGKIGPPVVEPALRAAASAEQEILDSIASVLALVGLHDDRIRDVLLAQLRRAPAFAGNLAAYGDPGALPHLLEALDAYALDESGNLLANSDLMEIRDAIEELGGTLSAEQERKCQRGQEPAEAFRRALTSRLTSASWERPGTPSSSLPAAQVRGHDKPGRNDPCWCGSGKKYKKCHLAADERGMVTGE